MSPLAWARLHQRLQGLRPAVLSFRRKRLHSVITPIVPAGRFGKRHKFDRGDAEIDQIVELFGDALIGAGRRKRRRHGARRDGIGPRASAPAAVGPSEGSGVDDFARAMDVIGLETGCWIGNGAAFVDDIGSGGRLCAASVVRLEPAAFRRLHRQRRPHALRPSRRRCRARPEPTAESGRYRPPERWRRTAWRGRESRSDLGVPARPACR